MGRQNRPLPRVKGLDPIVNALLDIIDKSDKADYIICQEAGFAKDTINRWRRGFRVYIPAAIAVAQILGYELILVRKPNAND